MIKQIWVRSQDGKLLIRCSGMRAHGAPNISGYPVSVFDDRGDEIPVAYYPSEHAAQEAVDEFQMWLENIDHSGAGHCCIYQM